MNSAIGQYIFPAEWEPHEATWLSWPHNSSDWPGKFPPIPWVFGEIVRKIVQGERIHLIVESKNHELKARRILERIGVDLSRVTFFRIPTDRGWMRDSGPMFVRSTKNDKVSILNHRFNGWAKYSNWHEDDKTPARISNLTGIPQVELLHKNCGVVLEGGSVDVNGSGSLLTTEECLLDQKVQARNPRFAREDYESVFHKYLGISNVIWLGSGIAGDDTHGHVDDLCRFVNRTTVVLCSETNPADPNYKPLNENRERLQGMRLENGSNISVVGLPMPSPVFLDGRRLPASYANFYFSNAAVLVPTFNDLNDARALGILSELIHDRPVVGIHSVDLAWGLGTLHCLTQQQPLLTRGEKR
jgi:agmatine deiminase